jgi:hypothetical protein
MGIRPQFQRRKMLRLLMPSVQGNCNVIKSAVTLA